MHIKLNKKNLNVKNVLTNDAHISRKFNFLEPSTADRYFLYLSFELFVIIFKLNILKKKCGKCHTFIPYALMWYLSNAVEEDRDEDIRWSHHTL